METRVRSIHWFQGVSKCPEIRPKLDGITFCFLYPLFILGFGTLCSIFHIVLE